jgi:hypothetical protein
VAKKSCFALKSRTAINFFIRNLPRLDELVKVRVDLIKHLLKALTANERQFLVSIKAGSRIGQYCRFLILKSYQV